MCGAVKWKGEVSEQIHNTSQMNGKGEQVGNEKVNNESKTDDAGREGPKMKMRIFYCLSL